MVLTLRVEYVPLFSSTDEIDLQPVVNYLTENNIKFKKGVNQVFVDSRKKADIEFDLTTQGIVSPEVAFADTWSQLSLTATEKIRRICGRTILPMILSINSKKFENVRKMPQFSIPNRKTFWVKPGEDQEGSAYVMPQDQAAIDSPTRLMRQPMLWPLHLEFPLTGLP